MSKGPKEVSEICACVFNDPVKALHSFAYTKTKWKEKQKKTCGKWERVTSRMSWHDWACEVLSFVGVVIVNDIDRNWKCTFNLATAWTHVGNTSCELWHAVKAKIFCLHTSQLAAWHNKRCVTFLLPFISVHSKLSQVQCNVVQWPSATTINWSINWPNRLS